MRGATTALVVVLLATTSLVVAVATQAAPAQAASGGSTPNSCESAGVNYSSLPALGNAFFSLPPWSDGVGWSHPDQYRTIMNGDVDGDGNGELVARNASTIEVFTPAPVFSPPSAGGKEYNPPPNQWTQVFPTSSSTQAPDFSEASGWWDPARYWTFHLARITGRGTNAQPAMDLLYRTSTGLEVRTWNPAAATWNAPITQGSNNGGQAWSDANGWSQSHPERYRTITTGDIDGNGRDEIIGNGPDGIETWGYDPGSGQLQRLDTAAGNINDSNNNPPKDWTSSQADLYLTLRLADVNGDGKAELVWRDPDLGLRVFSFGPLGNFGTGWWELSGANPPTNNWVDSNGWNDVQSYANITTGDLDGNGTADVVGRGPNGVEAWTYANGGWSLMAPVYGGWGNGNGFTYPQYTATFQTGRVLTTASDPILANSEQVIIKGGSGVGAAYLVPTPGGAFPYGWQQSQQNIYAFADGYGWSPPGAVPTDRNLDLGWAASWAGAQQPAYADGTDMYYGTIKAVSAAAGQPQAVIGRNSGGIWTTSMYAVANPSPTSGAGAPLSGHSPSAPFPAYTNLSAIGGIAQPPAGAPTPDLSQLSTAGRAYWGLDNAAGRDTWPGAQPTWTLLNQFTSASATLPDSQDFRPYYTTEIVNGTSTQVLQSPVYQPGIGEQALNVDRDTYNNVGNDLGDWTSAVSTLRAFIYGANGLKALNYTSFIANPNAVAQIQGAFESNPSMRALIADLIWGVVGGLAALTVFFPPAAAGFAFVIGFSFSVLGADLAFLYGNQNPNASVQTFGNNLQQQILNHFCSVNNQLDANYQQIVGDYGLLVSAMRIAQQSEAASGVFPTTTASANQALNTWVWQQFANRPAGKDVQNWWVGYCTDGSNGCPWHPSDEGVWTAPENANVTYRLVGQNKNGSEANCGYGMESNIRGGNKGDQAKNNWNSTFTANPAPGQAGLGPPGPAFASPRHTDTGRIGRPPGTSDSATAQNTGILGWNLGTQKCN